MKATLFALFVALLMVGCGESSSPPDSVVSVDSLKAIGLEDTENLDSILGEAIEGDKLERINTLMYAPNEKKPYSGWAKELYGNGQAKRLIQLKNGEANGPLMMWYESGEKKEKVNMNAKGPNGIFVKWSKTGLTQRVEIWKDGQKKAPNLSYDEEGKPRKRIESYAWYSFALANWYKDAKKWRDEIQLTAEELIEAEALLAKLQKIHEKMSQK